MRSIILVVFLIFSKSSAFYCPHVVPFGQKGVDDVLLASYDVEMDWSFFFDVFKDIVYPKFDDLEGRITFIKGIDLAKNGACVCITEGGPGSTYAYLHVTAQRNQNLIYKVEIYGKPTKNAD